MWPTGRSSSPSRGRGSASRRCPPLCPGRQPRTTQSISRSRFTFAIPSLSPGRQGASSRLAIVPSVRRSHSAACPAGVRVVGCEAAPLPPAPPAARAARANGTSSSESPPSARQVEDHVRGGDLLRQQLDPRPGRLDAALERVDFQAARGVADHEPAIDDIAPWPEGELGEERASALPPRDWMEPSSRRRRRSPGSRRASARRPTPRRAAAPAGQRQLRLDRRFERQVHRSPNASAPAPLPAAARRARLSRGRDRHAASSAFVYGSSGGRRPGRRVPSRRSGRCITAIRSETWRTTPMSWATKT